MKIFTQLKAWQLFVLFIGIHALMLFFSKNQLGLVYISSNILKTIFGVVALSFWFVWILSIGLLINKLQLNPYKFNSRLLVVAIIFCILGGTILYLEPLFNKLKIFKLVDNLITPFYFIGMFYTFWNVPRSLKSLELGRKVGIRDSLFYIFFLFFLPVGVWIIQPKINMIDEYPDPARMNK